MTTLGFRYIQDYGITGSNNVKSHLLFKPGSSFISLFRSIWNVFHFSFKSKRSTFNESTPPMPPTQPKLALHPCKHTTHASTNSTSFLKLSYISYYLSRIIDFTQVIWFRGSSLFKVYRPKSKAF